MRNILLRELPSSLAVAAFAVTLLAAPVHSSPSTIRTQVFARIEHGDFPLLNHDQSFLKVPPLNVVPDATLTTRGTSSPPLDWAWANPQPNGDPFISIAEGNGVYVAVGGDGVIYRSTDATHWTQESSEVGISVADVIYAQGQFVASVNPTFIGAPSPGEILTSTNGTTWTAHVLPNLIGTLGANNLAYGNGIYVAIGDVVETSSNGQTWTENSIGNLPPPTAQGQYYYYFEAPVFGNGTFVTLGYNLTTTGPANYLYDSANGSTWSPASITFPTASYTLNAIGWNGSEFVALGVVFDSTCNSGNGCGLIYTSPNGVTWTRQTDDSQVYFDSPIVSQGTTFVTFGNSVTNSNVYEATSTNGINWTVSATPVTNIPSVSLYTHSVLWTGSQFLAATQDLPLTIATSPDFSTWNNDELSTGPQVSLYKVIWGDNEYAAVGPYTTTGADIIMTSPTGSTWTTAYSDNNDAALAGIAWSGNEYVAVGQTEVLTSTNGINWTVSHPNIPFRDVAYGDGKFVGVGDAGTIATSVNGTTWTPINVGTTDDFASVVWNGSMFVAVTNNPEFDGDAPPDGNYIFTSPNGTSWTPVSLTPPPANTYYSFDRVKLLGSTLYAVGGTYTIANNEGTVVNPVIATSGNGTSWTVNLISTSTMGTNAVTDIAQVGTEYVATAGLSLFTSSDAVNWVFVDNQPDSVDYALASNDGRVVAVGNGGDIVYGNPPPTAEDGSVTTRENTAVNGVLSATGIGPLTFAIATQPSHGSVTLTDAETGAFTYTPDSGYAGNDSFTFTASNSVGTSVSATESVTVTPPNTNTSSGGGGLGLLCLAMLLGAVLLRLYRIRSSTSRRTEWAGSARIVVFQTGQSEGAPIKHTA